MKAEYTEKDVNDLWDKVSYWRELSDELAGLVEEYFSQDFGGSGSHNCQVLKAIEYLKSKL